MLYSDHGFKPISYSRLFEIVHSYAGVIRSFGLNKGDKIAIQSESCKEWAFVDWASQTLGIVVVPIYPTLPTDQTQYIVSDSGASIVIASSQDQAAKVAGMPGVKSIPLKGSDDSVDAMAVKNVGEIPMDVWEASIDGVNLDDIATIIYTSGTTGPPKGAMLPHRAICFVCESALETLPINDQDTFLSFLPMSHVYERVAGQALPISAGGTIAYAKSLMTLANDMLTVKPTVMLCVPRFLEATRDRILDAVKKDTPLKQKLFQMALDQGAKKVDGQFAPLAWLLDILVGQKIRARTGGRIRFFVSGGAALPPHVSRFYRAFGLNVLQGYGLTETTAATCINHPDRNRPDTVGEPLKGLELKIASDGEILIRGPSRMAGYYNLPKETAEAIDSEGWFHSGDIGVFEGAHVKITDRKKDLLILANGKNVAPQPIENKLRESPLITEAVLFGDGSESIYGLIIPNWDRLRGQLSSSATNEELISLDVAKQAIRAEVDKVNKTLADFEKVKRHTLLDAEFTIEGGELTPSLKVKRKVVKEKYSEALEALKRGS